MGGPERHRPMRPREAYLTGVCETGKRAYWTKAAARGTVKELRKEPDGKGLCAYACPHCDYFHIGHLPKDVRRGKVTRQDVYGKEAG